MRVLCIIVFAAACWLPAGVAGADELDDLAQAIDRAPDDAKAYDAYALACFKQRKFDEAIRRLKVGVARVPDYGEGYYKLAYAYRQKKEWADAADYYRRYIALHPAKTDPYFGLGASLSGLGDRKGAISAYDRYISLEKSPDKQRFVDQARDELGKLDPTRAPARPATPTNVMPPPGTTVTTVTPPATAIITTPPPPRNPAEAKQLRASADELRKNGKLDEAIVAYQKALAADDSSAEAHNDLGNCYFGLKRFADAATSFRAATARDAGYALAWYNLAHALRKGDQRRDAVVAYRQYIKLKPDDPDPYYGLGQTLKALGDVPGAIEAFKKYVGMEKRPEEQRWVDKARTELELLEALQKGPTGRRTTPSRSVRPDGKVDGRDDDTVASAASDQDALLDPFVGTRDLKDPFAWNASDLRDPFADTRPIVGAGDGHVIEYSQALANYRRALTRHAEDVAQRYERGMALAAAQQPTQATRVWNGLVLDDSRLSEARRGVERVRTLVSKR